MRHPAVRLISLAMVCAAARVAAGADPVELKPRWEPGKRYLLKLDSVQDVAMAVADGAETARQKGTQTVEFTVDVAAGKPGEPQVFDLTYGRFAVTSAGPGTSLAFDSAAVATNDAAGPFAALRHMVGARLTLRVDGDGRIDRVEGVEDFVRRITQDEPVAKALVESLVSEKAMRQQFGGALGGNWQPRRKVAPGDTWSVEEAVPFAQLGSLQVRSDYRFDGWTDGDAVIAFTGRIDRAAGSTSEVAGVKMAFTLRNGRFSGRATFDPARGAMLETVNRFEGAMQIDLQPDEGPARSFTQNLDQTSTLRLIGVEDLLPRREGEGTSP